MRHTILALIILAAGAMSAQTLEAYRFSHREVGVYGTLFDFCDYSVYKFQWHGDRRPDAATIDRWNERLRATREQGKKNLVLIYTYDRVKHSRPLEEYLRNTDELLEALDRDAIDALCLSEENVTWNNGLTILNTISDHIRTTYQVPVYQWLTMPDVPHPKLHADGWIIDPYGFGAERFRRYVAKYLITGKPVIDCITASPFPHADFDQTAKDQVAVCREFAVPMFFFCVDRKYGSPSIWLTSTDADISACRDWLMGVVGDVHGLPRPVAPLESASYSTGRPIEVCGGPDNTFSFEERFATSAFVDDVTLRGFWGLQWDGESETLNCRPDRARIPRILLQWHFTAPFGLKELVAGLRGRQKGDVTTTLAASLNGHQWGMASAAERPGPFSLRVPIEQTEPPRELWVRVTVEGDEAGVAALEGFELQGVVIPPERREVVLAPGDDGRLGYADRFDSPRFWHLAEVSGGETLTWSRGKIGTHGVAGRGNRVELRWKLVSERPLASLRVVVEGRANGKYLGARNACRLSLGDDRALAEADTAGQESNASGWVQEPLILEVEALPAETRVVYLTLEMTNTSGVRTNQSNAFTGFVVEATLR